MINAQFPRNILEKQLMLRAIKIKLIKLLDVLSFPYDSDDL